MLPRNIFAGVTECEVARLNVAVTDTFEFIVTVQSPVPPHVPAVAALVGFTDHPVNMDPVLADAVNVTTLSAPKLRQLAPQ